MWWLGLSVAATALSGANKKLKLKLPLHRCRAWPSLYATHCPMRLLFLPLAVHTRILTSIDTELLQFPILRFFQHNTIVMTRLPLHFQARTELFKNR